MASVLRPAYTVTDPKTGEKIRKRSRTWWVRRAENSLALALSKKGALVKIVRLPPGVPDVLGKQAKQGLDDYLVGTHADGMHGPDGLRMLLQQAPDFDPAEAEAERKATKKDRLAAEGPTDPHRLARLIIESFGETEGLPHLRRWAEIWLHWDEAYSELPDKDFDAMATRVIKREFDQLNSMRSEKEKPLCFSGRILSDVRLAAQSIAFLSSRIAPPVWLDPKKSDPSAAELLPCRNGLISLPALVAGRAPSEYLIPPSPRFFCRHALDYDFSIKVREPVQWIKFLKSLWPDDPAAIEVLQEWFGYLLTPDTSLQKILLMVGPKRSGKGTIARVIRELVGLANCCGPTLSGLAGNFGLQSLVGKSVAIIADARLSGRTDQAIIVERLLAISGEDALSVPRKFREDVNLKP